jgi:hypothetical protein
MLLQAYTSVGDVQELAAVHEALGRILRTAAAKHLHDKTQLTHAEVHLQALATHNCREIPAAPQAAPAHTLGIFAGLT